MHIYGHVPNFLSPKFDLNTLSSFNSNHRYHLIHSNSFAMLKQRHQSNFVMVCARNVKSINCYAVKNNFFNCFVNFLCLLNAAEINILNWSLYYKRYRIALVKKKLTPLTKNLVNMYLNPLRHMFIQVNMIYSFQFVQFDWFNWFDTVYVFWVRFICIVEYALITRKPQIINFN